MAPRKKVLKLAVGDHVRLASHLANQHPSYHTSPAFLGLAHEPVDGLVLSIRDVKTGKLIAVTSGALDGHVIELVYDATFNPKVASPRNSPKGVERPTSSPVWQNLRKALRKEAGDGRLFSTAGKENLPFARMLDGWKVVKVRSEHLVSLEEEPAQTPEGTT
jgi:hypothetical protein